MSSARLVGTDQELEVSVDACVDLGAAEVAVEESDASVVVEVRGVAEGGDCVTTFFVGLDHPLGDRVVIDAFDDREVPLQRR